jgi:hypothetical protein
MRLKASEAIFEGLAEVILLLDEDSLLLRKN